MITKVCISKRARKDLTRIPKHILVNFFTWIRAVEEIGIAQTRKSKGYHDEPLKGQRAGQRSIRLNKAYRAIYSIRDEGIEVVIVEEVSKHEY
ncbi:MAG: type II toxin-antitoxin system mRNA interferase toxin, RelE/StbE family [Bdellovibrionota bacterium]